MWKGAPPRPSGDGHHVRHDLWSSLDSRWCSSPAARRKICPVRSRQSSFYLMRPVKRSADLDLIHNSATASEAARAVLSARFNAYHEKGLAGIEPYQRSSNTTASPAEDLQVALANSPMLEQRLPEFYAYLRAYPRSRPDGVHDRCRAHLQRSADLFRRAAIQRGCDGLLSKPHIHRQSVGLGFKP